MTTPRQKNKKEPKYKQQITRNKSNNNNKTNKISNNKTKQYNTYKQLKTQ